MGNGTQKPIEGIPSRMLDCARTHTVAGEITGTVIVTQHLNDITITQVASEQRTCETEEQATVSHHGFLSRLAPGSDCAVARSCAPRSAPCAPRAGAGPQPESRQSRRGSA